MKTLNKKLNHVNRYSLALVALLIISACGKNMHVSVPNVSGQSLTGTDKKNKTIHKDYLTGDTHIFKDKVAVLTDDELNALSGLPFLNASNDGKNPPIIQIGTSPLKTDKNKLAYVRASNVVFKAEFHIPPKEQLLQLKVLKLQLKGVRIYDATPSTSTTASNQLLCILGSNICSGQKSDADKNLNATFWKKNPDGSDGLINDDFATSTLYVFNPLETFGNKETIRGVVGVITIDLLDLFEVNELADFGKKIDWLMSNSVEVQGKTNVRRIEFSLGNNIYADAGALIVETQVDVAKLSDDFKKLTPAPALLNTEVAAPGISGPAASASPAKTPSPGASSTPAPGNPGAKPSPAANPSPAPSVSPAPVASPAPAASPSPAPSADSDE